MSDPRSRLLDPISRRQAEQFAATALAQGTTGKITWWAGQIGKSYPGTKKWLVNRDARPLFKEGNAEIWGLPPALGPRGGSGEIDPDLCEILAKYDKGTFIRKKPTKLSEVLRRTLTDGIANLMAGNKLDADKVRLLTPTGDLVTDARRASSVHGGGPIMELILTCATLRRIEAENETYRERMLAKGQGSPATILEAVKDAGWKAELKTYNRLVDLARKKPNVLIAEAMLYERLLNHKLSVQP